MFINSVLLCDVLINGSILSNIVKLSDIISVKWLILVIIGCFFVFVFVSIVVECGFFLLFL